MPNPTCAANCDVTLPPVKFSFCAPTILLSEIRRIFIARSTAAPFNDWTDAAEWEARMSETANTPDSIRVLTVIGDKPAAAGVTRAISNGRTVVVGKDHTLNVSVDDVTDENYEFMRGLECGGLYKAWYETAGGKMFGGNPGIKGRFQLDGVLARGVDEIEQLTGTFTWRAKFSPERTESPIFEGDEEGEPIPETFDTLIEFDADATPVAEAGVTATAGTTDAEQAFEFNAVTPLVGAPVAMVIKVATVSELTVDFQNDYLGDYFKYTDKAGVPHIGQFAVGDVNF